MGVGCDHSDPGCLVLVRLLVPNCSLSCLQPLFFWGELGVRHDEDALLPMGPSFKTSWMSLHPHDVRKQLTWPPLDPEHAKPAHVPSPAQMLIMLKDAPDNGVDKGLGCSS